MVGGNGVAMQDLKVTCAQKCLTLLTHSSSCRVDRGCCVGHVWEVYLCVSCVENVVDRMFWMVGGGIISILVGVDGWLEMHVYCLGYDSGYRGTDRRQSDGERNGRAERLGGMCTVFYLCLHLTISFVCVGCLTRMSLTYWILTLTKILFWIAWSISTCDDQCIPWSFSIYNKSQTPYSVLK